MTPTAPETTLMAATADTPEPIIDLQQVVKVFGSKSVLNGVNLSIPAGAVVGLVGTNGSGKSTLIKCLLGLLKPQGGRLRVLGEGPWNFSVSAKARLGYVPQTVVLYPWMTVDQLVRSVAVFYPNWDTTWSQQLLDRWELDRSQTVGTLSPGQSQKLGLVAALGHRPELLVLDEPVASLDPVARRELLRSLLELNAEMADGAPPHTILFSTHITADLERVASHLALLKGGQITLFDELDSVKDRVKRLRIVAASELPKDFAVRGALSTEVAGVRAMVTVSDCDEALLAELEQRWRADVTVEDLNLEDIFVELHHA
jgi:ABC-2 type transport system ATP-binding protein